MRRSINHRLKFASKANCIEYGPLANQPAFPGSPSIVTIKADEEQCIVLPILEDINEL